jgi:hypothetical protein
MDDPTRRSKKDRQNGMRLLGLSFPSGSPLQFSRLARHQVCPRKSLDSVRHSLLQLKLARSPTTHQPRFTAKPTPSEPRLLTLQLHSDYRARAPHLPGRATSEGKNT